MRRLIFIVGMFVLCTLQGKTQSFDNYKTIDSLTYKFYEEQNWGELIYIGEKAIKNNIDYFYLRMRIGIAYYEKQKYRKARVHFEKAIAFNSTDDIANEYLYYSYLYSGMKAEANVLTKKFSPKLKEKLKLDKSKLIDEIYFEGGPTLGKNPIQDPVGNNNGNPNGNIDNHFLLREDELTNKVAYFALGLRHSITKSISVFHSVSAIDIGKTQNLFVYAGKVVNDYHIFQRQYYFNANFYLGKSFTIKPAFHFINVNYDKLSYSFDSNQKLFLKQESTSQNDYAASITLSKSISIFNLDFNAVMAHLNNSLQKQANITATAFPLNNSNFYMNTSITIRKSDSIRFVSEFLTGGKIADKLWLEGFITFGRLYNYVEKNAYIVYNINDAILSRKGISLKYILNKNLEFALYYQYLVKENLRVLVISDKITRIQPTQNFINHTIIGGIKWTL